MEGLVRFAGEVTTAILAWLPLFCLAGGGGFLVVGLWLFFESRRAGSACFQRFSPAAVTTICGFILLGFTGFLNLWNGTLGAPGRWSTGGAMGNFDVDASGFVGLDPLGLVLAIVTAFIWFFRAVGAAFVLHAIFGIKGALTAQRRHGWGPPAIEMIAGACIMNLDVLATALAASFGYGGA